MTNTYSHAKRELDILNRTVKKPIIAPFYDEILALTEKFGNSGQSGGSAPYTAKAISQAVEKLLLQESICPITGEDDEWMNITEYNSGKILYQNGRCSGLFKDETGAWYIDAIIFDGDLGGTFTSNGSVKLNGEIIGSAQLVKSFPFTPKKFYIKVKDFRWKDREEKIPDEDGDWWTHELEDAEQLKEVFEYYNKKFYNKK